MHLPSLLRRNPSHSCWVQAVHWIILSSTSRMDHSHYLMWQSHLNLQHKRVWVHQLWKWMEDRVGIQQWVFVDVYSLSSHSVLGMGHVWMGNLEVQILWVFQTHRWHHAVEDMEGESISLSQTNRVCWIYPCLPIPPTVRVVMDERYLCMQDPRVIWVKSSSLHSCRAIRRSVKKHRGRLGVGASMQWLILLSTQHHTASGGHAVKEKWIQQDMGEWSTLIPRLLQMHHRVERKTMPVIIYIMLLILLHSLRVQVERLLFFKQGHTQPQTVDWVFPVK